MKYCCARDGHPVTSAMKSVKKGIVFSRPFSFYELFCRGQKTVESCLVRNDRPCKAALPTPFTTETFYYFCNYNPASILAKTWNQKSLILDQICKVYLVFLLLIQFKRCQSVIISLTYTLIFKSLLSLNHVSGDLCSVCSAFKCGGWIMTLTGFWPCWEELGLQFFRRRRPCFLIIAFLFIVVHSLPTCQRPRGLSKAVFDTPESNSWSKNALTCI